MKLISVDNVEEFARLFIPAERTELSEAVIDVIESNLNNTLDVIKDIRVSILESQTDIVLSIKRQEFMDILKEQLKSFEGIERYEDCARIVKLMQKLEAGSIVQSLIER